MEIGIFYSELITSLSLLYRYFHGRCSLELHDIVPSPLACPRVTRGLIDRQL